MSCCATGRHVWRCLNCPTKVPRHDRNAVGHAQGPQAGGGEARLGSTGLHGRVLGSHEHSNAVITSDAITDKLLSDESGCQLLVSAAACRINEQCVHVGNRHAQRPSTLDWDCTQATVLYKVTTAGQAGFGTSHQGRACWKNARSYSVGIQSKVDGEHASAWHDKRRAMVSFSSALRIVRNVTFCHEMWGIRVVLINTCEVLLESVLGVESGELVTHMPASDGENV